MSLNRFNPDLRLAGRDEPHTPGDQPSWRDREQARLAVVKENRIAAHASALDPHDPRWMLAMQAQARLQGSTLTPERREQLMNSATRLGLRRFEANLVIAAVQDQARTRPPTGGFANRATPTGSLRGLPQQSLAPTLRLMHALDAGSSRQQPSAPVRPQVWPRWFLALSAAAAIAAMLLRWLGAL